MIFKSEYKTNSPRPRLKKTWVAFHAPNNTIYLFNTIKMFKLRNGSHEKMALIRLLDGSITIPEIIDKITHDYPQIPTGKVTDALQVLDQFQVLEDAACPIPDSLTRNDISRYSRQIEYFSDFETSKISRYDYQLALKQSKVVLLGLGGVGSWVAFGLAGAGVGTLVGIDCDVVDTSNLQRQILYTNRQVGQQKASVAAETIQAFNPEITFEAVSQKIQSSSDLEPYIKNANLVIGLANVPAFTIDDWVASACFKAKIPYLIARSSSVGPLCIPYITACHCCNMLTQADTAEYQQALIEAIIQQKDSVFNSTQAEVFSAVSTPGLYSVVGGFIVKEVIKQLTKYSDPETLNHVFTIPNMSLRFSEIQYKPLAIHNKCPNCNAVGLSK